MSKRLLVMRHAKSSWTEEGLTDFQRPLNRRGLRVAPLVAEFIEAQGVVPDLIVSSSANRAKQTAEIFANQCKLGEDQQMYLSELYHASASTYLEVMARFCDDSVSTLLLVGHNPGLEHLVETLSGVWEPMPTAAVAYFDFGGKSWSEIAFKEQLTLNQFWRPKEIGIQ